MPFDPISATVAGAGLVLDFLKGQQARADTQQAMTRTGEERAAALRAAGALRGDQFGNTTYYDPTQGRWVTTFSPTQQRIIDEGQARQRRAQIRGAQASEDYDRLRAEYLFRKPKSEAESYAEIVNLINQAQGTGERALNTLNNRFGIRTHGNIPVLEQMDRGPSPGQQLAETMLNARKAALEEYGNREKIRSMQLPALKQFEDTANYVAPVDPTGSAIIGMQQQGIQDYLKTSSDYDKLLATMAGANARTNAAAGPKSSDFLNFAKMLMPGQDKTAGGTVGNTRGARAGSGGGGGVKLDNRFNYGKWDTSLGSEGYGGEATPRGLLGEGTYYPKGSEGGFNDPNQLTSFSPYFGDTFAYARPPVDQYRNNYAFSDVYSYDPDPGSTYANNPFGQLWQF